MTVWGTKRSIEGEDENRKAAGASGERKGGEMHMGGK